METSMSMRVVLLVLLAALAGPAAGMEYTGARAVAGRAADPCANSPASDGEPCDDGNPCTQTDTCSGGVCLGGEPRTCDALDQCHIAGTCDPATGECSNPLKPNDSACSDGDGCTQTDTCQAGVCTGADPVVCGPLDECHLAGACDPATGTCSHPEKPDGTSCTDDGFSCTDDRCREGRCEHVATDDRCPGDSCAIPVCLPSDPRAEAGTGCLPSRPTPDDPPTACEEDLDPCTDDYCLGGVCAHRDVPDRPRCNAVKDAYDRARGLLDGSATLGAAVAEKLADGGSSGTRAQLEGSLAGFAGDLEVIVRTLGGRAPADAPGKTLAERRAAAALPLASELRRRGQPMLGVLTRARRAKELSRGDARKLSRQVKGLLAGSRALERNLRRIRHISRIFTP